MRIGQLRELYEELPGRSAQAGFVALPIPGFEHHYLGRSSSGLPAVLISTSDAGFRPPVRLNGMEAEFSVSCSLEVHGRSIEVRNFTVLQCSSAVAAVGDYFLHAMEPLLAILGDLPRLDYVSQAVTTLAEIFQFLSRPAVNSVTGLIGELLVIDSAPDIVQAVRSWHNAIDERFDFACGSVRLEVKSTQGHLRLHRFAIDQVDPSPDTIGILCSIILEESAAGSGVLDLAASISQRLANSRAEVAKLDRLIAETLGRDILSANDRKFDLAASRATIQFYDLHTLPAVRRPIHPAIEDVQFTVNLSQVPTAHLDDLGPTVREGLAIIPRLRGR